MAQYAYISLVITAIFITLSALWIMVVFSKIEYSRTYRYLDVNFINTVFFNIANLQFTLSLQLRIFSIGEVNFIVDPQSVVGLQLILLVAFFLYVFTFSLLESRRFARRPVINSFELFENDWFPQLVYLAVISINYGLIVYGVLTLGLDGFFEYVGGRLYREKVVFIILTFTPISLVACIIAVYKTNSFYLASFYVCAYSGAALMSGGRGALVNAGVVALALLVRFGRGPKFSTLVLGMFLPVAMIFSLYTNYVRFANFEAQSTSDIWFSEFLESETFASWKSIYAVYDGDFSLPYPGYGLFSSLMFPIPRAIFEYKPIPPSTIFTMQISPVRFDNTGSEITLSGLGQFIAEFGNIFGGVAFGVFSGLICYFQYGLARSDKFRAASIVILLYVMSMWRADLFTASRPVWVFILISSLGFFPGIYVKFISARTGRGDL